MTRLFREVHYGVKHRFARQLVAPRKVSVTRKASKAPINKLTRLWEKHAKLLNKSKSSAEVVRATLIEDGSYTKLLERANEHALAITLGPYYSVTDVENALLHSLRYKSLAKRGVFLIGQ